MPPIYNTLPLSLTDPSGYSWFSRNWKAITSSIVGIAVSAITGGIGSPLAAAVIAGSAGGAACALTGALLTGANFGQIAKATFTGAVLGAAGGFLNYASADPNLLLSLMKHSFSQGCLEGVQGGNILHGMMMGAVSKAGGYGVDTYASGLGTVGALVANSVLSGVIDELGGGKFANGAITGAFAYLFNEKLHKYNDNNQHEEGNDDQYSKILAMAATLAVADGPLPAGDIIASSLVAAVLVSNYLETIYVTYTLTNDRGMIYIGRTSGVGTPFSVMMNRFRTHHMRAFGFKNPTLDRFATGPFAYSAIRGREQQMIDFYGGVGSSRVGNSIRGVSKYNPLGYTNHLFKFRKFNLRLTHCKIYRYEPFCQTH